MNVTLSDSQRRAESYKLLSDCYYLPDDVLVEKIINAAQSDTFFSELARHIPATAELEISKIDYAALFVGPYKVLAPPYGSVYLEDSTIMGESTLDVRSCYENDGLDVVAEGPADHIAFELEYMYYLASEQAEAIQKGNRQAFESFGFKQRSFMQTHLGRWLPRFAEKVQKNAKTAFYRNLARLTEVFVREDLAACESWDFWPDLPKSVEGVVPGG